MRYENAKYILYVRYSRLPVTEQFVTALDGLRVGMKCIMRTERGIEIGEAAGNPEEIGERDLPEGLGEILRIVGPKDMEMVKHIEDEVQPNEFRCCKRLIEKHNLPMNLVGVEHLYGGNKVIFYFLADGRVDFRELVKDLAKEYRTRIEMRQIGVRDEARLLGDYEHCGRELCCRTHLKCLDPVTMKMAKLQKTTLDPTKISGRCGRLMCCLRYEDEVYCELKKQLPRKGSVVTTASATGVVISGDVLKQTVLIDTENQRHTEIRVADIIKVQKGREGGKAPEDDEMDEVSEEGNAVRCCRKPRPAPAEGEEEVFEAPATPAARKTNEILRDESAETSDNMSPENPPNPSRQRPRRRPQPSNRPLGGPQNAPRPMQNNQNRPHVPPQSNPRPQNPQPVQNDRPAPAPAPAPQANQPVQNTEQGDTPKPTGDK